MKTIYQTKIFSEYWNTRAGDSGEAYKLYVLDPIMFKLVGSFKNKTVLELGCGNGYLASKFYKSGADKIIMMDLSKYNLEFAKAKFNNPKVSFLEQDATKKWKVASNSVDVVYSNAMLNEVKNIKTPLRESFRVLKSGGAMIFSVTHPAWDLYVYAQQKAGVNNKRMKGLGGYFERGMAKYIMSGNTKGNIELNKKFGGMEFAVNHYHRTISDYFDEIMNAGFTIKKMIEPPLNAKLLKYNPRFKDSVDHPVCLIFYCLKT